MGQAECQEQLCWPWLGAGPEAGRTAFQPGTRGFSGRLQLPRPQVFIVAFFVCRVLASPFSIIYPTLAQGINVLPVGWAVSCTAIMLAIYVLQVFWFVRIIKLAQREAQGDAKSKES